MWLKRWDLLALYTGLAAHLRGADALRLRRDRHEFGLLLENFVVMELKKQRGWSRMQPELFHFRTSEGHKVDVVLEDRAGGIVGIEIKAAATVDARDFKGLRVLAEAGGNRFRRGILLSHLKAARSVQAVEAEITNHGELRGGGSLLVDQRQRRKFSSL